MLLEGIALLHDCLVPWRSALRSVLVVLVAHVPTVFHQVKDVQVIQLVSDLMNSSEHDQESVFI